MQIEIWLKSHEILALCARRLDDDEDMYDMEKIESGLIFLGLIGIMDPPRPEVKDAIEICQKAGIKVKMITGDQQFTATAIGKELGITDGGIPAVNGGAIAQFSDAEMDEAAMNSTIFFKSYSRPKNAYCKFSSKSRRNCGYDRRWGKRRSCTI